jgi:phosphoglycerate dehydrogenase-like enzyme
MSSPAQTLRIVSSVGLPEAKLDVIRAAAPGAEVLNIPESQEACLEHVAGADIWLAHQGQVAHMPALGARLRWIQLSSAGAEQVFASPHIHADVTYTNASGVQSVGMAEFTLGLLLSHAHRLPALTDLYARRRWPSPSEVRAGLMADELFGMTLGLVGYGSINSALARRAAACGMRILACKRDPQIHAVPRWNPAGAGDPEGRLPQAWYGPQQLSAMLPQCDVVVVAIPLTPATRGLVGESFLRAMRPTARLINLGRGQIVQEPALLRALREGWIAGAMLDVVSQEPLPATSPLYAAPNLLVTPHISSAIKKYWERLAELFAENLRRYNAGQPLLNVIDREKGY